VALNPSNNLEQLVLKGLKQIQGKKLTELDFTDDMVLTDVSGNGLQILIPWHTGQKSMAFIITHQMEKTKGYEN